MGVEESRIWLGGIVSVLPIAMDCAKNCYKRLQAVKAYRDQANEYHFVEGLKIEKNKERGAVQFVITFFILFWKLTFQYSIFKSNHNFEIRLWYVVTYNKVNSLILQHKMKAMGYKFTTRLS